MTGAQEHFNLNSQSNAISLTLDPTIVSSSTLSVAVGENSGGSYVYGGEMPITGTSVNNLLAPAISNFSLRFTFTPENRALSSALGRQITLFGVNQTCIRFLLLKEIYG